MDLEALGWNGYFEASFRALAGSEFEPARVTAEHRAGFEIRTASGDWLGEVTGRFRHEARARSDYPAVGDWVVAETYPAEGRALIHRVLPRRSKFSRTAPGRQEEEQILAANVDDVFLVASLNGGVNVRRLERYLALAWESGADPVIVLTKADLIDDPDEAVRSVTPVVRGVPVYVLSSVSGLGMAELEACLRPARTVALLGPSGVGKSTLINHWCREALLPVQPVREADQKGRHTTTHRQLVCLPCGALAIDTPGMRELQLWEGGEGVSEVFGEIEDLAAQCRFSDCSHETEPGCAVRAAVESGALDPGRLRSHQKLKGELEHFERKHNKRAEAAYRKQLKSIHKRLKGVSREQG